jgi:hypothetical protein
MKGIQVYSNKGPGSLQRRYNYKNVKMGWGHLKIFFSRGQFHKAILRFVIR